MKNTKSEKIKKPPKKWLIFSAVSLVSADFGCRMRHHVQCRRAQPPQPAGGVETWAGKSGVKYAQISVFAPAGSLDTGKIAGFRQKIKSLRKGHHAQKREERLYGRVLRRRENQRNRRPRLIRRLGHCRGRKLFSFHPLELRKRNVFFRERRDARQGRAG
jgi:hypothetical protein